MYTRYHKDYRVVISKIYDNIGYGYRAQFSIPKTNGTLENIQTYVTYRRKTAKEVLSDVERIIDVLG